MEQSQLAGFNTIFFQVPIPCSPDASLGGTWPHPFLPAQVRGHATAHYDSKLEPWSETYGWKSPGFDPLHLAVRAAHERHLAIHAWMNGIATSVLLFLLCCCYATSTSLSSPTQ